MEHTRSYSVKGVLAALGKSLLYLLFFIMAQFLTGVVYTAAVAVRTALAHREMDVAEAAQLAAERLLAGAPAGRRPSAPLPRWGFSWRSIWCWLCCRRHG